MKPVLQVFATTLITVVISLPLSAREGTTSTQQASDSAAIINGSSGSTATYPWMAFLADQNGEQYCGASLISPTWVLTAAHCFLNDDNNAVDIVNGALSNVILNSDTVSPLAANAIVGAIGQIIIHPDYQPDEATSPNANDFDMALVELTAAVDLQPVALLSGSAPEIAADTEALILGWGTTAVDSENESINPSNTLLKAQQKIVDSTTCAAIYGDSLTGNMLCAGGLTTTDTTDTCQGDSGGPLTIANGESFIQVGIVSFGGNEGPSCGDPESPGVYAKVSALSGFIQQHASDAVFSTFGTSSNAPVLSTTVSENTVTISWTPTAEATGYILYYAPFPDQAPIGSLDVGTLTSLSGELPSGSAFYVAVQPYTASGPINIFSNVDTFTVP